MEPRITPLTTALEQVVYPWPAEDEALLGRLRWFLHTPYAHAVVATNVRNEEDVRGLGGAITLGTTGWITLLRSTNTDGPHTRTAILRTLVAHLENAETTAQCMVAAPGDVPLLEALGFQARQRILRYTGGRFLQATRDEVDHLEPWHRMAVLRMDRQATGEDRSTLLLEHEYLGRVYAEDNAVRGFTLALLGEGLIIADTSYAGLELQRWHFPIQEHLLLPEGNLSAHAHLTERGYHAQPEGTLMVRGDAPVLHVERIYAWPWGAV